MKLCLASRVSFLCLLAGALTLEGIPATVAVAQVTSVSQLSAAHPTDWTFQALQSLVERYSCIAGYPTFWRNRVLTRYEFATRLQACLDRVQELIAAGASHLVRQEDIATLQRLQQEFATELTALRGRVDNPEAQTAQLETNQFSTTTKLNGELFAVVGMAAEQDANGFKISQVTTQSDRVRLNFDTNFTGNDLLRVQAQALNLNSLADTSTQTPLGHRQFSSANPTNPLAQANGANNNGASDALSYAFPIGKNTTVVLDRNADQPDDFTNTVNPYSNNDEDNDVASDALSNFETNNPIYNLSTGTGIGLRHEFGDQLELSLGYLVNSPANSERSLANSIRGNGLFDGPYGAIGQLTIKPSKSLTLGLTYVKSSNIDLGTGSDRANPIATYTLPVSSNSYGFEASYQVTPKFLINGWVGYTATRTLSTGDGRYNRGDLSILNYAVSLAFPGFGKPGSLTGIIFGMEPRVIGVSRSLKPQIGTDRNNLLYIEGFIKIQL